MGVVCQNGVVGIVSAVGEKYALVVPVIHTNMNLSCRLKKNDYIGRTQWLGKNHREVKLEDISRHISVELGDTIITSGLTPIFPQGLMVGTVISSDLNEGDNYHNIQVELSTDYQAIKYVQVIYNRAAKLINDPTSETEWSGLEK
jgi:rod shape-determining protein MreC